MTGFDRPEEIGLLSAGWTLSDQGERRMKKRESESVSGAKTSRRTSSRRHKPVPTCRLGGRGFSPIDRYSMGAKTSGTAALLFAILPLLQVAAGERNEDVFQRGMP